MNFPTSQQLATARERYVGKRIEFIEHLQHDPAPLTRGDSGICEEVDDAGHLHVAWKSGRTLALVPTADRFAVTNTDESIVTLKMPAAAAQKIADDPKAFARWMRENGYNVSDIKA